MGRVTEQGSAPARAIAWALALGAAAGAVRAQGSGAGALPGAPRPGNVLLVIADEVGTDRVRAYGENPAAPPTPTLDALAADGVLFRHAWANPTCSPTRSMILTGRHGFRTGIGEVILYNAAVPALPYDEVTLPELLARGTGGRYATALVGKWHLGSASLGGPFHALQQGFDAHVGLLGNTKSYAYWTKYTNGLAEQSSAYVTTDQVDDALAFAAALPEPWFLCLAFTAAHTPYHAPPAHLHGYALSGPPSATPVAHFDAAVQALDTELGRLLDSMDPSVRGNTTVLFVGDNGPPAAATTGPYAPGTTKGSLFEGGINVPLIAAGRGVPAKGRECRALVSACDLYATVAALAGFDARDALPEGLPLDSLSLAPYFVDPDRPSAREVVYAEKFTPNGALPPNVQSHGRALRDVRWKLIERDGAPDQLYDLQGVHAEGPNLLPGPLTEEQKAAYQSLKQAMSELLAR